ncbi:sugar ABC transporter substrate-binding protein [bacterium]|nr:sugar ABC transporter substrate-binding protein [bacterium]
MQMRFRLTILLTLILLVVSVGPQVAAQDEVVLSFVGPEQPSAMEPVIAAFEAANPGIRVEYESVPFVDLNDILQTRMRDGGSTPDIFTADQPRISALVERGFLLDITDEVGDISDMVWPSSLDASTVDGRLYALPISTSTQILYYNLDLLEAAGLEPPSREPENRITWEQLVQDAAAAQEAGAEWGFMFDQVNRIYQIQPLPESLGGGPGVSADNPLEPNITNAAWVEALSFYGDLFESGLAPRGIPVEQTPDLFANGQVAYFVGGPWWLPRFGGTEGLNFDAGLHPYFAEGEPVTPTGAWSWGVNPNSEHIDEAIAFITFAALDPTGALRTAEGFPLPPANIEVFNTYYAENQVLDGIEDLILYELENTARVRAKTEGFIEFEEIIGQALEDIRNGADARGALETASEDLEAVWSR